MHMITVAAVLLMVLSSLIILGAIASNDSVIAETEQGFYIGRQKLVNGTSVRYWYGVPYAQQPIGNLRWMPPKALSEYNGANDAFIPNACPQKSRFSILLTESCLTLNVYAPEKATDLPVYVWIHGGSFTSGAGAEYDAAQFISTSEINSVPVVIVTINYRLGLLGFMADQGLYEERSGINNRSTTGNYGILDQMMALDWIKKNIQGFGGNPNEITIGGESAGGISVTILLTSSLVNNGTFQRAIIESGGIWPNAASSLQNAINSSGDILRASVGCTTVQCLRSLTVEQILTVQDIIASKSIFGSAASPVIDGYVLNDIMENNYARGNFQKVPVLIGSNTNETSLFTCPFFNSTANTTQVQAFFNLAYNATIISEIPSIYGPISAYDNPLTYLNIVYSDSWLHCGSRRVASRFSSHGVPSYFYTYDHLIPVAPRCFGVTHAAELPMLFPFLLPFLYPDYTFTPLEEQLSMNMMLYWANFIHTSDPNYPGRPANWDAYLMSSDNDFVLDIIPRMRNYYYNFTCSRLWDLYAVTNTTLTASTAGSIGKHHYSLLFFVLFVAKFVSVLI